MQRMACNSGWRDEGVDRERTSRIVYIFLDCPMTRGLG